MPEILAAVYARVSSDQQAEAGTIGSQVAALRVRVAEDGLLVPTEREFLDDGISGATLVRPALERLRDPVRWLRCPKRSAAAGDSQALSRASARARGQEPRPRPRSTSEAASGRCRVGISIG